MYSLTCLLLDIDKLEIMLPAVIIFHAHYCTKDFTPMFLVEDNWWFLFTSLVCKQGLQISLVDWI